MAGSRSHLLTFLPFLRALVKDGHNVTVTHEDYEVPKQTLGGGIEEKTHILKGETYHFLL